MEGPARVNKKQNFEMDYRASNGGQGKYIEFSHGFW
jgi:hypothetical protein